MNLVTKTETGAETAPRMPKLGYKGGRAPQLSARGTLATSGAGVVCHTCSIGNLRRLKQGKFS